MGLHADGVKLLPQDDTLIVGGVKVACYDGLGQYLGWSLYSLEP